MLPSWKIKSGNEEIEIIKTQVYYNENETKKYIDLLNEYNVNTNLLQFEQVINKIKSFKEKNEQLKNKKLNLTTQYPINNTISNLWINN